MGAFSDIGALATERAQNRRAWGKAIISALVSAVISIVGTTWKVRGYVDDIEHQNAQTQKDLQYLKDHLPTVEQLAIDAKHEAQDTKNMLYAHLGGWPPGIK